MSSRAKHPNSLRALCAAQVKTQVEDSLLKVKSKSKSFPKKRGGMYFSFSSDFDGLEELCPVVAGVGF
ncbi:MAG TPA: hypothetical protein VHX60_04290, partial [Acidobacteriaceae bacterium]|nr:hypothetical protein [Acidobacteriaceae bacterium]